jgi:hypothetical protein
LNNKPLRGEGPRNPEVWDKALIKINGSFIT